MQRQRAYTSPHYELYFEDIQCLIFSCCNDAALSPYMCWLYQLAMGSKIFVDLANPDILSFKIGVLFFLQDQSLFSVVMLL